MTSSIKYEVEAANSTAIDRMMESEPVWVDVGLAKEKIPDLGETILHAGPPVGWDKMGGPMKGALIGALLFEGRTTTPEGAAELIKSGAIRLDCSHNYNAVGPMAGVISPSMPVFDVIDKKNGNHTYTNMNEGLGEVLRYGAHNKRVVEKLRWMSEVLAPVLKATIEEMKSQEEGLHLKPLITQALTMSDDCHNRCNAATSLFMKQIAPYTMQSSMDRGMASEAFRFMSSNNFTTLNLVMAAAKAMTVAAHNIKYSTVVSVMSRNGTDCGIWVSGVGNKWFAAPAPVPKGVWLPGYSEKDASPDIGDSAITETAGFGGFAMAAAPAIVSWVGGSVKFALEITNKMYSITTGEHRYFRIPYLNFRGTPTGIDIRKVVKTGITPTINTGIAHRNSGVGQIGAGLVSFPPSVFKEALRSYAQVYGL